jgi:hypothetical protein
VSESKGVKLDANKPDMSLIPAEFLIECAKSLSFGARKYSAHNYRNGILTSRLLAAAQRHLTMEINGVSTDPESGLSHLAHALASLAMYSYMKTNKPDFDDRYTPSDLEVANLNKLMYGV